MSAVPLFDVTVTRSGREEHLLRLEHEREEHEPAVLAEALVGISAENLYRLAVNAELAVLRFETREKRALDLEPLFALQRFVIQENLDAVSMVEIPEDALDSIHELTAEDWKALTAEGRKALEALGEEAPDETIENSPKGGRKAPYFKLESVPALTPEQWKALDFLAEIIGKVPLALACWRVQAALGTLRELHSSFSGKVLPAKLDVLLRHVGGAVSKPSKDTALAHLERRGAILTAWEARASLSPNEREDLAARLGYVREPMSPGSGWASIARLARLYGPKKAE
jgi:hypothetical protein